VQVVLDSSICATISPESTELQGILVKGASGRLITSARIAGHRYSPYEKSGNGHRHRTRGWTAISIFAIVAAENQSYEQ
jgi:hypothetical protein